MKCAAIGWNRRSRFLFKRRECPVACLVFTIHRQYLALANPGQPLIIRPVSSTHLHAAIWI
jgi:hypothetical protein